MRLPLLEDRRPDVGGPVARIRAEASRSTRILHNYVKILLEQRVVEPLMALSERDF
jgi:hypothetical protein